MKNTDIDFSKLKENTPLNIQRGMKREKFFTALRSYVFYPASLLCLLLGLIFTAEDGASYVFGASDDTEESTVSAETDTAVPDTEAVPAPDTDIFETTEFVYSQNLLSLT